MRKGNGTPAFYTGQLFSSGTSPVAALPVLMRFRKRQTAPSTIDKTIIVAFPAGESADANAAGDAQSSRKKCKD